VSLNFHDAAHPNSGVLFYSLSGKRIRNIAPTAFEMLLLIEPLALLGASDWGATL